MNSRKRDIAFGSVLVLMTFMLLSTLPSCKLTRRVPEGEYLLTKVKCECDDKSLDINELETAVKQKPNRKMLFMFRFHLRVYNMATSGKPRKWKTKIANVVGEPPVIYDSTLTDKSIGLMKDYLRSQSYYDAKVSATEVFKRRRAKVTYHITPGTATIISKFDYDITDDNIRDIVYADTLNSLIKTGDKFNTDVLRDEIDRLVRLMKVNGYYYFSTNNIHFFADTLQTQDSVDLTLSVRRSFDDDTHAQPYVEERFSEQFIRNVYIYADYNPQVSATNPVAYEQHLDTLAVEGINIIYTDKLKIKPAVILQSCYLKSGNRYDIRDLENTRRHLSNLKQFKSINVKLSADPNETIKSRRERYLDAHIYLTPLSKQSYVVELEGNNTSGNIGMASAITYTNRNLFRSANIFSAKGTVSFQTVASETDDQEELLSFFNTLEYSGEIKLKIPKLLLPFFNNYKFTKRFNPQTNISTLYSYQKRPDYTRSIANVSFGYQFKSGRHKYFTHHLNIIEFNLVKIFGLHEDFKEQIRNLYIKYAYADQLLPVISYDMIFNNQRASKLRDFSYLWVNIETSGNIPSLIYRAAGLRPDTTGTGCSFMGIEFAQYVKLDIDYRFYKIFGKNSSLVFRGFFGIGIPYGNSAESGLPFVKKYFIGGANDIRAWKIRTIGPGGYYEPNSGYNQIADMKLMFNMEYRFKMFSIFNGAFFLDAGNIWAIDPNDNRAASQFTINDFYKQIALGTGFGIRLDLSLFVIRFDFGIPIYTPVIPEETHSHWFDAFKHFKISNFTFNFGINYPF